MGRSVTAGRQPHRAVAPPVEAARADLALVLVWAWLALVVLARGALAFLPGMWLWGLDLQRFLPRPGEWVGWVLCVVFLIPPVGSRVASFLRVAGDRLTGHPRAGAAIVAVVLASVVWLHPDEAHFTGDFLMRLAAVDAGVDLSVVFPQALPLDLFLHHRLPVLFTHAWGVDAQTAQRLVALPVVAALGVASVALARILDLRGTAAVAAVSIIAFGGWLGLFTGLGKPFGELCLLALATAVFAVWMVREGRGHMGLGVVLALGFWLHRAALGLLLPAAIAWLVWLRSPGRVWRPATVVGAVVPLAACAAAMPRLVRAIASTDARNFLPHGEGGMAASMFAPLHLLDVVNVTLLLCPLVPLLPVLAVVLLPALRRRAESAVMLALVVPFGALLVLVHPPQGVFRDWDLFAPSGMALAAATAWLTGIAIMLAPRRAWLAAAVVFATAVPALQWVSHLHQLEPSLQRVERFLVEPPARPSGPTAVTWSYLGIRYSALGRADASAEAWAKAAELAPSPRYLVNFGVAEESRGRLQKAREVYLEAIDRDPRTFEAWLGVARVGLGLGRLDEAREAAMHASALRPSDPEPRAVLDAVRVRMERADRP